MDEYTIVSVIPVGVVITTTILMLMLDLYGRLGLRLCFALIATLGTVIAMFYQLYLNHTAFDGLIYVDGFSFLLSAIILVGTALTLLLSHGQLAGQRAHDSVDVDVLLILAAFGGMVMVSSAHLILTFVAFELLSVSVYALTGIAKREQASAEGAMKYFIQGAFSSAFLIYGMALLYGATGSMELPVIRDYVTLHGLSSMGLVGLGLIVFGFAFKVAAVPFHFWAPDVYQGAPVSIAAYMAVAVKAAAFGSFLRIAASCFGGSPNEWQGLLWVISALTMTVGNLLAVWQRSVKRMLAYSSISHAGYALMGFLAIGAAGGAEATVFYLLAYSFMTIAAFGVLLLVTIGTDQQYAKDDLSSFSGLGWRSPLLGVVMVIALLSLAGMPPLGGFVGKLYLFSATIEAGYTGLAIIAALNSVVSLYYYLGVIVVMYFGRTAAHGHGDEEEPDLSLVPVRVSFGSGTALAVSTVGTLLLGIYSQPWLDLVRRAVSSLTVG